MPSINITAEQAAALARGENITIEAPHNTAWAGIRTDGAVVILVRDPDGHPLKYRFVVWYTHDNDPSLAGAGEWVRAHAGDFDQSTWTWHRLGGYHAD